MPSPIWTLSWPEPLLLGGSYHLPLSHTMSNVPSWASPLPTYAQPYVCPGALCYLGSKENWDC